MFSLCGVIDIYPQPMLLLSFVALHFLLLDEVYMPQHARSVLRSGSYLIPMLVLYSSNEFVVSFYCAGPVRI
jgi:hypothetical protein